MSAFGSCVCQCGHLLISTNVLLTTLLVLECMILMAAPSLLSDFKQTRIPPCIYASGIGMALTLLLLCRLTDAHLTGTHAESCIMHHEMSAYMLQSSA